MCNNLKKHSKHFMYIGDTDQSYKDMLQQKSNNFLCNARLSVSFFTEQVVYRDVTKMLAGIWKGESHGLPCHGTNPYLVKKKVECAT